ncbi:PTCHD3 [Branchiostoma lanceolatum]|uniref:Patched domain-containing protein 3 n=1 Tax=Branchiostoma lanceolatum TaxID=7740 RepID=A0A8K0A1C6_BRALA|nr:PTCHD3 [Branchiostoma lanceolatum]
MVAKILDSKLRGSFFHYGRVLANCPAPFIVLPLVLSAVLGYFGGSRLILGDDLEYLFTPEDGQAKKDGAAMRDAGFQPTDLTASWSAGRVIVTIKDDSGNTSILRSDSVDEILRLNDAICNATNADGETFTDLCFRTELGCLESNILGLMSNFRLLNTSQDMNITYPYYNPFGELWSGLYLGDELGGVETARDSRTVLAARAVQLIYHVNATGQRRISMMTAFHRAVADFRSDNVLAFFTSGDSLNDEILTLPERVMPYLAVSGGLLIVFAVGSCTMTDCVLTKPWVALVGVMSAGLAVASSVGLVLLCGETFPTHVAMVPFLLLGIGVDDMFIMIASWRKTDPRLAVPERTGHALADAATAITITSITDCVAFAVGTITVFPAVRIFCIYAAVGVAFDYIYQITFFAAILSLAGRREKAGRHWLTCHRVPTNEEAGQMSSIHRLCCSGGTPTQDGVSDQHQDDEDRRLPFVNKLLCNYLAPFVVNPLGKLSILLIFIGYLGIGIWGCFHIRVGLEFENLVADDSFVKDFYRAEQQYFKEYGPKVDIVDTGPCEYWKKEVQEAVRNKMSSFDHSPFFKNSSTTAQVWLEDYLLFLNNTRNSNAATDKTLFLFLLNTQFLPTVGRHHKMSIIFNSNFTAMEASRFVVIARNVKTKEQEKDMMLEARRISEHGPLKMSAYCIDFVFSDQIYEIFPSTLQTILIAAAAMFVVSLIFIPHCISTVLVTFALVSIDAGLVGYMALWGVQLDIIATISLIVCIGFSVDFSAHITYAYVSSEAETTGEKMREALQTVGMPIIQSSMSTVLGLLVLAFFPAYLFRSFFKTMFLVMVFGSAHGLLVLPVFLTTPCPKRCVSTRRRKGAIANQKAKETGKENQTGETTSLTEHSLHMGDNSFPMKRTHYSSSEMSREENIERCLQDAEDTLLTVILEGKAAGLDNPILQVTPLSLNQETRTTTL